jgi:methylglutaconyl-CoA hydratase
VHLKNISFSIDCSVAHVVLNRPPVNALDREFVLELTSLGRYLGRKKDVWIVAVSSALKTFCAGADLKERASLSPAQIAGFGIQKMVQAWLNLPQPVLMRLDGPALGGGLEFALAGDIIVASEDALLGFPEVGLGIIPGAGGTQTLARRTNLGIARKWILTGRKFSAREALSDGVVDIVAPSGNASVEFDRVIAEVSSRAPLALRQAKKAVNKGFDLGLGKALAIERSCYAKLIPTRDREEALQAFLGKRSPVWQNK